MCSIVWLQLICELMCWPMEHGPSLLRQSRCAALQGSAISLIEMLLAMRRNSYVNISFTFDGWPRDRKMPKRNRKRRKIWRDIFFFLPLSCLHSCQYICTESVHCLRLIVRLRCACLCGSEVCARCMNRTSLNWVGQNHQKSNERRQKIALLPCRFSALRNSILFRFTLRCGC